MSPRDLLVSISPTLGSPWLFMWVLGIKLKPCALPTEKSPQPSHGCVRSQSASGNSHMQPGFRFHDPNDKLFYSLVSIPPQMWHGPEENLGQQWRARSMETAGACIGEETQEIRRWSLWAECSRGLQDKLGSSFFVSALGWV